jgi:CO/xanthine dehydrogenase FAD-binding subunit
MRTPVSSLTLLEPRTLAEALRMLRDERPLPIAGCTDVYVALNAGTLTETRFLNLWGLDDLRGIERTKTGLRIGALTTYTELLQSKTVARAIPMLAAAAREVGGVQIHNRGTIGGNIANGSPAGDTLPVLAAADAILVLRHAEGARRVPFNEFYTGYRASVRRPDELIVSIEIPGIVGQQWFRKVGTRAAQSISKVVMAAVRSRQPRIALGSVAATVVRARRAEEILGNGGSIEDAQAALAEDITPIDDIRSTAAYRRRVTANLLRRFWEDTSRSRRP